MLTSLGQTVSVLALNAMTPKNKKQSKATHVYSLYHPDEVTLDVVIAQVEQARGAVDGVIWLQSARAKVKKVTDVFDEKGYRSLETVFLLAKRLQESLNRGEQRPGWFFVVSRGDGQLSLSGAGSLSAILPAGVSGLTKSLNIEWKTAFCRTLDIDTGLKNGEAAHVLLEELQDVRRDLAEVGRSARNQRMTLALSAAPIADEEAPLAISAQDILVVTGGARGITAQCVIALAQRSKARFVLLGRTDINAPLPEWAAGAATLAERKAAAIASLQSAGEQPTPVKIDAMLSNLLHSDEINTTLQQIARVGGEAIYRHCDITDAQQVARVLNETRQSLGSITGIIHGAGNLADKRIEKKTLEDLRSVFNVKVRGLENLCRALDITALRHVMLFSSVSGFFGNAGQTDYAMANETLNKFAWLPQQVAGQPVVRAINWGPWDGGMVNDTLKRAYDAQNMVIIPRETGTAFLVREFTDATYPQVIIGGDSYRAKRRSTAPASAYDVTRLLQRQINPFLQHHMINGNAVLPAAAAIAWMTRVCEERFPGYQLLTVSHFIVLKGIVFDGSEVDRYRVTLMPHSGEWAENDLIAVDLTIASSPEGKALKHYQATLLLAQQGREAQFTELHSDLEVAIPLSAPLYGDMTQGALLFHGDDFRGIQQVVHMDEQSLVLKCRLPSLDAWKQGQFQAGSFNLFINDVGLQLPLLWLMQRSDKAGLPTAIGSIEQFTPLGFDQTFYATMQVTSQTAAQLLVDITLHDELGNVYSRFEKVQFTVSTALRSLLTGTAEALDKTEGR